MSNDNIVPLSPDKIKFNTIDEALKAMRAGKGVIVIDDEGRENEGDIIFPAATITPSAVNFMAKNARGLICVALPAERAEELDLQPMVDDNTDPNQTAFTISVDASPAFGVGTGISAQDRAVTIQRLASADAKAKDFRRPGHIFPLQAQKGGVLKRAGHTEAAIDLARLAGFAPVGVICEIMNDDGTMARRDDLYAFAKKYEYPFISIAQLIAYLLERERFVKRVALNDTHTRYGAFKTAVFRNTLNGVEHFALIKGDMTQFDSKPPVVRIHNEDVMNDLFGSSGLDGSALNLALRQLQEQESAVLVYLRQSPEQKKGLAHQITHLHDAPVSDDEMTAGAIQMQRDYGVGAQILYDLGINAFRLMTDSKRKMIALKGYGLNIVDTLPLTPAARWQQPKAAAYEDESSSAPLLSRAAQQQSVIAEPTAEPVSTPEIVTEPIKKPEPKIMTMRMGQQIVFEG